MASRRIHAVLRADSVKALRKELDEAIREARGKEREHRRDHDDDDEEREGPSQLAWIYDRARLWAGANDHPDWTALARAREHRERMAHAATLSPGFALGRWEFIGPNAFDAGGGRYVSGRVNAIALDPHDHDTIYAGAAGGGLWKSEDNGITWISLSDVWPYLEVSSIAVDPNDSSVVYVGTGDFPAFGRHYFGVLKSTDAGNTFSILPFGEAAKYSISGIVVDPDDSRIVTMCGGRSGGGGYVWQSKDSGKTWRRAYRNQGDWTTLVIGADDGHGKRAMYACGHDFTLRTNVIIRSFDRGATWTSLSDPKIARQDDLTVAVSPLDARGVYFAGAPDRIVMGSDNYGNTWTDITSSLPVDDDEWENPWYYLTLTCGVLTDPVKREVLFFGLRRLHLWDSAGTGTWTSLPGGHDDIHALTLDPVHPASRVMIGNDGGVYELERTSSGWDLNSRNADLHITQCYRGSASATTPTICLVGTQDNSVASSQSDLRSWGTVNTPHGGDAIAALVNPSNDKIQFAETGVKYHGIARTANRWSTKGVDITPATGTDFLDPMSLPMAIDAHGKHFYWGTDFLWLRSETTGTWTGRIGAQKLAGDEQGVRCIGVAASDDWRVFTGSTDGQVWMGQGPDWLWTRIDNDQFKGIVVSAIAVNPNNEDDIVLCIGGTGVSHVWRCRDTTAATPKWEDVHGTGLGSLPDLPAVGVVRHNAFPDTTWFVALEVGVFVTEDGGTTWKDITLSLGLPNVQLSDLQLIGSDVYLFTYGRGVWLLSPSVNPG